MIKILALTVLNLVCVLGASAQNMNNEKLDKIIRGVGQEVDGKDGAWTFVYQERALLALTDERNNRMRIVTPIDEVSNLTKAEVIAALTANFHSALDVKYAISDDLIWSVFIHPLEELSDLQVLDAMRQVVKAADTFGSTYSSTDMFFPGGAKPNKSPNPPVQKKKT